MVLSGATAGDSQRIGVRIMMTLETSYLLVIAARKFSISDTAALRGIGLTPTGLYALEDLECIGAMDQARLAQLLYLRPQTIGHLLSRFEHQGWVTRRPSGHRNYLTVTITDQGRSTLAAARQLMAKTDQRHPNDGRLPARAHLLGCNGRAGHRDREEREQRRASGTNEDVDDTVLLHTDPLRTALEALRPFLLTLITSSEGDMSGTAHDGTRAP
ncbi:MarR family winged helix-turn-helix transcriptional regulator [Arthrobacter sp. Soc17.1.1.1]|uniref:MarR family winged helix-turn-helix transcriptional regulator n=1 Tax=Arthrobacter sp. Soc17.1.1.1 TaxID=3121277 RepID=UPI003FA5AB1A